MGNLHKLNPHKPRKLGEVEWTASGVRLSPAQRVAEGDWFRPAMLTVPLGVFLIVLFW